MTIAEFTLAIVIGRRKETTGIGGLTFQAFIGKPADAAVVQHVTESAIVISVACQRGGDVHNVRHGVLLRCVCVCVC